MPRTTARRATTAGLGALAATTALALAAGPVAAATQPAAPAELPVLTLDAAPEDVLVSVFGSPADEDQQRLFDATLVSPSGRVDFELPAPVRGGTPDVQLVDLAAYEDVEDDEVLDVVPLDVEVDVDVVEADGVSTLELTIPMGDSDLEGVDDVELTVSGLAVDGLPGAEAGAFTMLDLRPSRLGQLVVEDPARVEGLADASIQLDDLALQAGGSFAVELPEGAVASALGIEDLSLVDGYLFPVDDELVWTSTVTAAEPAESVTAALESVGAAAVSGRLDDLALEAAAAAEEPAAEETATEEPGDGATEEPGDGATEDGDDYRLEPVVSEDGRSAVLTSSAALPAGDYALLLSVNDLDADVGLTGFADVQLSAAPTPTPTSTPAPAPTPTVTVTQPAPTATVTTAPAKQNPGLRSNTGVEGGGVDGGLVAAAAGLLAMAAGAGVLAVRTGRRGRRA